MNLKTREIYGHLKHFPRKKSHSCLGLSSCIVSGAQRLTQEAIKVNVHKLKGTRPDNNPIYGKVSNKGVPIRVKGDPQPGICHIFDGGVEGKIVGDIGAISIDSDSSRGRSIAQGTRIAYVVADRNRRIAVIGATRS